MDRVSFAEGVESTVQRLIAEKHKGFGWRVYPIVEFDDDESDFNFGPLDSPLYDPQDILEAELGEMTTEEIEDLDEELDDIEQDVENGDEDPMANEEEEDPSAGTEAHAGL